MKFLILTYYCPLDLINTGCQFGCFIFQLLSLNIFTIILELSQHNYFTHFLLYTESLYVESDQQYLKFFWKM